MIKLMWSIASQTEFKLQVTSGHLQSKLDTSTIESRANFYAKNTSKAELFLAGCIPKDILSNLLFIQ